MAQESSHFLIDEEYRSLTQPKPEEIREEMTATRAALTDKLETLEANIVGTVKAARDSVKTGLGAVKEGVLDTVTAVRESAKGAAHWFERKLDINRHVEQQPWSMVGISAMAGYVLGHWSGSQRQGSETIRERGRKAEGDRAIVLSSHEAVTSKAAEATPLSRRNRLVEKFSEEIDLLERIAIGAAMGIVRDWLKKSAPNLSAQIHDLIDSATMKMGGEPIKGPVLQECAPDSSPKMNSRRS